MSVYAETACTHNDDSLVNPWEIIRKYRCTDCSAVLTCACDSDFATFIVPHQAMRGVDRHTRDEVAVTHPLMPNVCPECRGEVPPAYPRVAHRGAASLVRRYYWREIRRATELKFLEWCQGEKLSLFSDDGRPLFFYLKHDHEEKYEEIEHAVIEDTRLAHEQNPKYDFTRPSDADVIKACDVTVESVKACYVPNAAGPALVLPLDVDDPGQALRVEEFIERRLRAPGREVMFCESRPFQALYGSLMWLWVQAPGDSRLRLAGFGGRDGVGADERGIIWTLLPHDFGSPAHARRRAEALESHLNMLPDDTDEMLQAYDYWQEPSRALRQYLWAYTKEDQQRAQTLIETLGACRVKTIMRYLAEAYWERYLGWPDLLSWQPTSDGPQDVEFVEVKSSSDKLSDDQRSWIQGNHDHLRLPFRIVKVHRTKRLDLGTT